jgi:hypothetical protein
VIRRIVFLVILLVLSFVVLTARADAAAALTGSVRNAEGEAIAGASVSVTVRSKEFGFTGVTDAEGRYTFRPLPAGEYRLRANHPDYAGCSLKLTITEGEVRHMDIVLPAAIGTRERPIEVADAVFRDSSYERQVLASARITNADRSLATAFAGGPGFRSRLATSTEAFEDVHVDPWLYASDTGTGAGAHIRLTSRRAGEQWRGGAFHDARTAGPDCTRAASVRMREGHWSRIGLFVCCWRAARPRG